MSGNSFGQMFRVTTAGESHGPALIGIIDGCPPGLSLTESDIQPALDRRRPGTSRAVSQRREADEVEILAGVFDGRTTGAPIALMIRNQDARARDYEALADRFRPGHADYTVLMKYGIRDHLGGGRASARETAMRVAAGAVAAHYLEQGLGVRTRACLSRVGDLVFDTRAIADAWDAPYGCPDQDRVTDLEDLLQQLRAERDSIGAEVLVVSEGLPVGLGEPVFGRLDAELAGALMSINAVKAVAIGDGFDVVAQRGSVHRDEMSPAGFLSNHAGGVLGGISSGQALTAKVAFKPTSSIPQSAATIDLAGAATEVTVTGRHDPCVGIRGVPVVEAMTSLVIMDHLLRHRAQCADVAPSTPVIPPGVS
jgi:chorismate synthase